MSRTGLGGYAGKFLRVDLIRQKIDEERFDEDTMRKYIGGTGIGAKVLYDEVPPGIEWNSPENRLIIAQGPLGGTVIMGSGSISVVTKGPMTNGATSTQANGYFGAYMKLCGYDGIILHGAAKDWVYLHIGEGTSELRDANWLLGMDTYVITDLLKHELGKKEKEMSVVSIGPAGENLVRFAGIFVDKGHSASHNGVGAVMGAKRLKAIAANHAKGRIAVRDREKLTAISQKLFEDVKTLGRTTYDYGTLTGIVRGQKEGWIPVKNYTTNVWPIPSDKLAKFGPEHLRGQYDPKPNQCWACAMHHCYMFRIPEGPYMGEIVEEPEYEQFAAFGPAIDQTEVASTVMLSKEIDRLGMDTNEAGWVVGFAMECYEREILKRDDLNGLEMNWGNAEGARLLLNLIAKRQGIGNILAEGVMRASQQIGGEAAKMAIYTMKGDTPRGHDHRTRWSEMFDTCVSSTSTIETTLLYAGFSGTEDPMEISTATAKTKGMMPFEDSMVTCRFNTRMNVELLSQAVAAATGWNFTYDEGMEVGRRIVNLLRAFNIRHGMPKELDYPSSRYGSTPVDGPATGKSILPFWNKMLENYYNLMRWDVGTGKPLPETLRRLGLDRVAKDLWGSR